MTDGDGVHDCNDNCPSDANKIEPGVCGCGTPDTDGDGDGLEDCIDACPADNPGEPDVDGDGCTDTLEDLGDNLEAQSTDQFNDAIEEILSDPYIPDSAADEVQDALDDVIGKQRWKSQQRRCGQAPAGKPERGDGHDGQGR